MTLERALEVALAATIEARQYRVDLYGSRAVLHDLNKAAATLREFKEKGLPFYRAAEAHGEYRDHAGPHDMLDGCYCCCETETALVDAYRAMKEASK